MRNKFLAAGFMLVMVSCSGNITTDEQRAKYEKCRVKTADYFKAHPVTNNDSLKAIQQDIIVLDLEAIVKKHKIKKEEINSFISSVCISAELNDLFNNLDSTISAGNKKIDSIMQNIEGRFKKLK